MPRFKAAGGTAVTLQRLGSARDGVAQCRPDFVYPMSGRQFQQQLRSRQESVPWQMALPSWRSCTSKRPHLEGPFALGGTAAGQRGRPTMRLLQWPRPCCRRPCDLAAAPGAKSARAVKTSYPPCIKGGSLPASAHGAARRSARNVQRASAAQRRVQARWRRSTSHCWGWAGLCVASRCRPAHSSRRCGR